MSIMSQYLTNLDNFFHNDVWTDLNYKYYDVQDEVKQTIKTSDKGETKIILALPGVEKETMRIDLKMGQLVMNCKVSNNPFITKKDVKKTWSIDKTLKQEDISAKFENGILEISIKKPEENIQNVPIVIK